MADVEHPLTENQMVAIAAGLWCRKHCHVGFCSWGDACDCPCTDCRKELCPDMRLPENLWRALENVTKQGILVQFNGVEVTMFFAEGIDQRPDLFAALVALYKAEHPE